MSTSPAPKARAVVFGWRSLVWIAGLPLLAVLWAATTSVLVPVTKEALLRAGHSVVRLSGNGEASGEPWLRLDVDGRDLVARGEAPGEEQRQAALAQLEALPGLRRIVDETGFVVDASPFVWQVRISDRGHLISSGHRPTEIGAMTFRARLAAESPASGDILDEAHAARGAPPNFLDAASFAIRRLEALKPGGVATVADTVLSFDGEAANTEKYEAFRSAVAAPPSGFTVGTSNVAPPVISDFRLVIEQIAGGGTRLSGHAASETGHRTILAAATEIAAGGAVEDRLQVARGLHDTIDEQALDRFVIQLAGLLREGRVAFEESRVSVSGRATDTQAVGEIESAMRDSRPAGVAAGSVVLTASPVTPYRLRVSRDQDRVLVTGHVPDAGARASLLAALRTRFFSEKIVDRSRMAEGAPVGFVEAARTAISALATLARGEIEISDRALSFSGESLYRESAERLRSTVPSSVPAGWTSTVSINARGAPERYDTATCSRLFTERVVSRPLRFAPGSSELTNDFYAVLDAAADLAGRCTSQRLEVSGYADPTGTPLQAKDLPEYTASLKQPDKPKATAKEPNKKTAAKAPTKTEPAKEAKAEEPAPEPVLDLTQQRSLAVVEYLLQAGVPNDRAVAVESGSAERRALGLALRP